jgi:hypothetical protein
MFTRITFLSMLLLTSVAIPGERSSTSIDYSGTWVGKWDNTWCVQFTIVADYGRGAASVTYVWKEEAGQPLRSEETFGEFDGSRLQIKHPPIEIFLSQTPDQAVALGHFSEPRSAVLVREPTRRCEDAERGSK